jgi:hypothetical protein
LRALSRLRVPYAAGVGVGGAGEPAAGADVAGLGATSSLATLRADVVLKALAWALAPPCGCLSLQTLRADVVLEAFAWAGPISLLSLTLPAPWVWRWSPNLRSDDTTLAERLVVSGSKAQRPSECKNRNKITTIREPFRSARLLHHHTT